MKSLNIAAVLLLICVQIASAQQQKSTLDHFRSEVLPGYSEYFSAADQAEAGQMVLAATEKYCRLSGAERQGMISKIAGSCGGLLVIIRCDTRRELWEWNAESGTAQQIDSWDLNPEPPATPPQETGDGIMKHPWFFYVGSAQRMDSEKNINGALNLRAGFFLLRNRWDLAASFAEQVGGNLESEDFSLTTSLGLMSKVYFPVKKYNLSPNLGAEAAVSIPVNGTASFTPSFIAGVSWFTGPGSLDVGFRFGRTASLMLGYTLVPKIRLFK